MHSALALAAFLRFRFLLEFRHPESVEIAVRIYGNGLFTANAEIGFGLAFRIQIMEQATALRLNRQKDYVVFFGHRMWSRAHFHAQGAFIRTFEYGKMLFHQPVGSVGREFHHLFAAAEGDNAAVNKLNNNITTVFAEKEFCFHNF